VEPTLRIAPLSALLVAAHLGMASTRCRAGMVSRPRRELLCRTLFVTQPYGWRSTE
jgi:hypothetical protein